MEMIELKFKYVYIPIAYLGLSFIGLIIYGLLVTNWDTVFENYKTILVSMWITSEIISLIWIFVYYDLDLDLD